MNKHLGWWKEKAGGLVYRHDWYSHNWKTMTVACDNYSVEQHKSVLLFTQYHTSGDQTFYQDGLVHLN